MKRLSVLATALLMLVASVTFAQNQGRGYHNKSMKRNADGKNFKSCIAEMNLTDAQLKQFNDLKYDHQKAVMELDNNLDAIRLDMKKVMTDGLDAAKLKSLNADASVIRNKKHDLKIDHWVAVNEILTDDQKAIWKKNFKGGKMMGKRHKSGKGKMGHGSRRNCW